MTAAQLIDKVGIQPRFVNLQLGVGQQAVTIETFNIVAFIGAAVAPDIHAVFFHCGDQHRAGHGTAQRRGIEIGQSASRIMESAALNRCDPFCNQLLAAINQAGILCAILHCATRNGVIVILIRLSQIRSIGIWDSSFLSHPQQRGASVQTAGKSDTNTLTCWKMLKNRRHRIEPCLID
ncbi:Uncharacterised protein [Salmonella enterica subsp. enterica serovar Typhi]|nr:Uncharacterised protein [Salmonella enterica subsp. enterica serovar Typhi]CGX15538.1 Uncharacterised protein [Salmonella enterica subsp. enterica serovar Typhi]CQS36125.1 Uncharacterised protein [Salmonella enterica subsp. enterica serovar Typhi]